MSRNNNQPPPYGGSTQSSHPVAPSGSSTDPRLPLYHQHHHYYHRYKSNATVLAIPLRTQPVAHVAADTRALERFWSALFIGFFLWLAIVVFTNGIETLRLAAIGLAGALKAILDDILRELRQAGWDV